MEIYQKHNHISSFSVTQFSLIEGSDISTVVLSNLCYYDFIVYPRWPAATNWKGKRYSYGQEWIHDFWKGGIVALG